ncbi:MAG TPA: isoprenylcysteine carboxylmethyltransferase family protein, partial [Vicinamibacterales bacterium]|nr:isoprenylcysteine carboxylmethyltransferase family protein [Vicinamibacterales bacterium]
FRGESTAILVDTLLFALFAAHHSILARESGKRALAFIPPHLIRSVYVWTASVLLFVVCILWRPIGGDLYRVDGAGAIALAAVQMLGVVFIARSVALIDALDLAGIRISRADSSLQTSGPYRWVRHPLYLGWMLLVFGAAHMTADRFAFAAISSTYLLVAVPWEERSLRQSFGNSYADYQRRVRWRVIPYVY